MAATISINFSTPEEVFSETPPSKKSVSAKTLNEVLGGGTVGGGYVQRNGQTPMTSYLTLFSAAPNSDYHAVHKKYVDDHAFTRRYFFSVGISVSANSFSVSGPDDNSARFYFFAPNDDISNNAVQRYVDVYRNGVLQVFGSDYTFSNVDVPEELVPFYPPRVNFFTPLVSGSNVAVHIGNKGATPAVVGVAALSAIVGSGIRVSNRFRDNVSTGELSISAWPYDFEATNYEVQNPTRKDRTLSPVNLSAHPLVPRAYAQFRRYYDPITGQPWSRTFASDKYGRSGTGNFTLVRGMNIYALRSGVGTDAPETFTCYISTGVFQVEGGLSKNYSPIIQVSVGSSSSLTDYSIPVIYNDTKALTGFKFTPLTLYFSPPIDVDEVSIAIY